MPPYRSPATAWGSSPPSARLLDLVSRCAAGPGSAHPTLAPGSWATAQGLASLPPALAGYLIWACSASPAWGFDWPLGPRPLIFVAVMLAIGLLASWLGTLMWNRASRLLPAALTGQLIVFETLAALGYAFVRGALRTRRRRCNRPVAPGCCSG